MSQENIEQCEVGGGMICRHLSHIKGAWQAWPILAFLGYSSSDPGRPSNPFVAFEQQIGQGGANIPELIFCGPLWRPPRTRPREGLNVIMGSIKPCLYALRKGFFFGGGVV